MKNITMIAVIGPNNELGKDNKLLWHLPEDLKFFQQQTMGKYIVMGKKTLDSLPYLLPGRTHLVLTHQKLEQSEQIKKFHNLNDLIDYISQLDQEVMVIGGAKVYQQMIDLSNKILLTEVDDIKEADTYFPLFDKSRWNSKEISNHQEGPIKYKHIVYTRK